MSFFELKNDYIRYVDHGRLYYGGNQMLSEDSTIRKCGCGLVAAADLFLYMHRYHDDCKCPLFDSIPTDLPVEVDRMMELYKALSKYFAIIPPLGISGIMLSLGINTFFIRYKYPYYARWGVLPSRLWDSMGKMLNNDIPVIIAVGPDFPLIWQKHSADMYFDTASGLSGHTRVRAHFMTLTAMDDVWLHLSSWGKKYRIKKDDYLNFIKNYSTGYASNIVLINHL